MDHSTDLDADPVIYKHLIEIEGLLCDPIPKGLGLSKRCVLKLSTILTIKFKYFKVGLQCNLMETEIILY